MYSTSKCMESGTTINRGNENLFDDASFLPFPRDINIDPAAAHRFQKYKAAAKKKRQETFT